MINCFDVVFMVCFHRTLLRWTNIAVEIQQQKNISLSKRKKQEYFSMEDWKPALGWDLHVEIAFGGIKVT